LLLANRLLKLNLQQRVVQVPEPQRLPLWVV
jgi:hypothetical protein